MPDLETAQVREQGHSCPERKSGPLVNGVRIDPVTPAGFLARIDAFLACGRSHVVHFCAAHPTVEARRDVEYRELLNKGDLNLPDGMPVAWAARLNGYGAVRLAGTEGMHLVFRWGLERGLRHFLYGGTEATLQSLERRLHETYPGVEIVGTESPPFRPLSDDEVKESAARIQKAGAQVVWVGLGAPKQDVMAARLRAMEAGPAILCVGAAFDFVAGSKPRAPAWMQRAGLEWVFRLASEPRRLWRRYLVGNTLFMYGVLGDRLRRPRNSGKPS